MNVRTMLTQVNERLLWRLAEENGWPLAQNEETSLSIDNIVLHITDFTVIERTWLSLTPEEKEVLLYFLFRVGNDIVTYRQMEEYAKTTSPLAAYSGLTGLRRRGLVYTLRRLWGEIAYCLPNDVQVAFRMWLLSKEEICNSVHHHPMAGWENEAPPLSYVLFRLLQLHRQKPIMLTKKETMSMKTRRLWHSVLPYSEEAFVSFETDKAIDGGGREQFMLDILESLGLLRKQPMEDSLCYTVDEAQAKNIFSGQEAAVQRRLYRKVKEKLSLLHPCYPVIWDFIEACQDRAFSLSSLLQAEYELLRGIASSEKNDHWSSFEREVVPLLISFGFISKKGEGENAVYLFHSELLAAEERYEEGEYGGSGYVQPTFEILLLPHASYEVRWELGAYAELEEQQEVWRFRLTKASVQSVEHEQGSGRLLRLLERIQPDVPENVREQINQWQRSGVRVTLTRMMLLRCPNVETATWLAGEQELVSCFVERLNERDFLVEEAKQEKLEQALARRHVSISENKAVTLEERKSPKAVEDTASTVLAESGYKVESVFPALTDVLPELKEVPAIWHRNFQRYHHSTLRKLMETARVLGAPLSAEISGRSVEGARVLDMKPENGQYRLTLDTHGKKEQVGLDDIGRIKLIFPMLSGRD